MRLPLQQRRGPWTVADIGGTHARLASWSAESGLGTPVRVRNDDFAGPVELLEAWLGRFPDAPRQVVLALAMPVGGDTLQLTNRAWRFEPISMIEALHLDSLVIVNDFAAAAAGLLAVSPRELHQLNPEVGSPKAGTRLVLGPGTGLGTAAILADDPPRILASEAGHMTFGSAGDELTARLVADGLRRWGRVSWERALCGEGLAWIDALLRGASAAEAPPAVARRAEASDAAALAAVRLFSRLLGEYAGDVCLAFQALGGVYLGGGVLRGIARTFDAAGFLAAFRDKGRFEAQLAAVPCFVAADHELGIEGAACFLAGRVGMPAVEWTP